MDALPTVWFIALAVLWIGYLLLEGFDLGVGMHMLFRAKTEDDKRVMLNTIGPIWDGNQVWLLTAGAGTFAAFPLWYASLFSALYIPLTLVLAGLIFRAVAIEYRGKGSTDRWRKFWDYAIGLGSTVVAFGLGAGLTLTTIGLPLDKAGDRVGGPFVFLTTYGGFGVVGGIGVALFCYVHGANFLALKTDGPVRVGARKFVKNWMPLLSVPILAWVVWVQLQQAIEGHFKIWSWLLVVVALAFGVYGYISARGEREGWTFVGYSGCLAFGAAAIFCAVYPVVLPSTIDHAYDLTVTTASSSDYTLGVMTVVTCVALPVVLAYQAWSIWIFRKRLAPGMLPKFHEVLPAVKNPA